MGGGSVSMAAGAIHTGQLDVLLPIDSHREHSKYYLRWDDAFGTRVVSSADQYRAFADECFGWARTAKTEHERAIFLQMAQTWLAAAVRARSVERRPEDGPNQQSGSDAMK
jgi:hypothetical protein